MGDRFELQRSHASGLGPAEMDTGARSDSASGGAGEGAPARNKRRHTRDAFAHCSGPRPSNQPGACTRAERRRAA